MRSRVFRALVPVLVALSAMAASASATPRTTREYKYFRALSIDLVGRMPTRAEIAAFERDGFDLDAWIDARLRGPAYTERVRRIYMDAMRLDLGPAFAFTPSSVTLRRQQVLGPDGRPIYVYFRFSQRRTRPETDGDFCLTQAETGLQFPRSAAPRGTPRPVTQAVLDANTVLVRPWWLYRDYRAASPTDRYNPGTWATRVPGFTPAPGLLVEPDGTTATTQVRVCREEAQTVETAPVYTTGRTAPAPGTPPPYGRLTQLPLDSSYARLHPGVQLNCATATALTNTVGCGCGKGLERCMPGDGYNFSPGSFVFPVRTPLGPEAPLDQTRQTHSYWHRYWWGQEAEHFLDDVIARDRDFRDVLTARDTQINGPLAQFYRSTARSTCCNNTSGFDYVDPVPLFDPSAVPASLLPHDVTRWMAVTDRGPNASGLLTMPIFLTKYGSRRARAHVLYQTFMCREFVAENVALMPSTEPDLTRRSGCSSCHTTLEPMSAFFARVSESDWTFLPASVFPANNTQCAGTVSARQASACRLLYDPAFTDRTHALLRGAYGSLANADAGPAGLARQIVDAPEFPACVASNVAGSFLGRALGPEDAALRDRLASDLASGGFHMRALVRAIVTSAAYRDANDLSSDAWRQNGAQP